ncbi:hypothetical protein [Vibrio harveyi]|uniref:hypothetical protein n=1 Tax=Vibrio harveyi TaxID=669 RepID=UPI0007524F40|nr:hypothetical protein [Vibrio harveyi]PNM42799.1 hypothetical protein AL469_023050 [Vibrio harveyi]
MFFKEIICSSLLFTAISVNAMSIDKMMLFADGHNDFYKVTNTTEQPLFILTSVTEKEISNNTVKDINYTSSNLDYWKINISPARFILSPGESKLVYVNENLCIEGIKCSREKDTVFTVGFVPQVYVPEGEKSASNVGILFGFAPTFVLPPDVQKIDYDLVTKQTSKTNNLTVKNKGNTMLTVMVDQCEEGEQVNGCTTFRYVHNDRTVEIPLPKKYVKGRLKVKVLNGEETYIEDYIK